jgi:hypothetical protein
VKGGGAGASVQACQAAENKRKRRTTRPSRATPAAASATATAGAALREWASRARSCAASSSEQRAARPRSAPTQRHGARRRRLCSALNARAVSLLPQPAAMNLSLVDPFVLAQDCPEVITGRLRASPPAPRCLSSTDSAQAAATRRRSASATAATCWPLDA